MFLHHAHTRGQSLLLMSSRGFLLKRGEEGGGGSSSLSETYYHQQGFSVPLTTSSLDAMHYNFARSLHCTQDKKLLSRWKPSHRHPYRGAWSQTTFASESIKIRSPPLRAQIAPAEDDDDDESTPQTIAPVVCKRRMCIVITQSNTIVSESGPEPQLKDRGGCGCK